MTRNTVRRVEVAAPVFDEKIKKRISDIFSTMLCDNVKAREQGADSVYRKKKDGKVKLNAQEYFYEQAYDKNNQ